MTRVVELFTHRIRGVALLDICLFALLTTVFILKPGLDLIVSSWFYIPDQGFYLSKTPLARGIYASVEIVVPVVAVWAIISGILSKVKKRSFFGLTSRKALFLVLALALGPGLVVNGVLKEFWGRARPSTIEAFGGDKQFSPAMVISDQCESNCSFSSGHASGAFFLLVPGFVLRRRKLIFALGTTYGLVAGMGRVVQGGHFMSDVLFSGFFVYITAQILFAALFPPQQAHGLGMKEVANDT